MPTLNPSVSFVKTTTDKANLVKANNPLRCTDFQVSIYFTKQASIVTVFI